MPAKAGVPKVAPASACMSAAMAAQRAASSLLGDAGRHQRMRELAPRIEHRNRDHRHAVDVVAAVRRIAALAHALDTLRSTWRGAARFCQRNVRNRRSTSRPRLAGERGDEASGGADERGKRGCRRPRAGETARANATAPAPPCDRGRRPPRRWRSRPRCATAGRGPAAPRAAKPLPSIASLRAMREDSGPEAVALGGSRPSRAPRRPARAGCAGRCW